MLDKTVDSCNFSKLILDFEREDDIWHGMIINIYKLHRPNIFSRPHHSCGPALPIVPSETRVEFTPGFSDKPLITLMVKLIVKINLYKQPDYYESAASMPTEVGSGRLLCEPTLYLHSQICAGLPKRISFTHIFQCVVTTEQVR